VRTSYNKFWHRLFYKFKPMSLDPTILLTTHFCHYYSSNNIILTTNFCHYYSTLRLYHLINHITHTWISQYELFEKIMTKKVRFWITLFLFYIHKTHKDTSIFTLNSRIFLSNKLWLVQHHFNWRSPYPMIFFHQYIVASGVAMDIFLNI
jgi:hypothetical protein